MSKKDIFGDDIVEQKDFSSFESLFAESSAAGLKTSLKVGDNFTGEILSIGKEEAFVSTGSTVDGMIATRDLLDENKEVKYKVGDQIECVVISNKGGELRVAKKGALGADADSLEDAFDMELPVEGRVTEAVNGGFRVQIMGKTAFCPISQIDSRFVQDGSDYINKKFDFIITKFEKKGRDLVVSRRKLLEVQKAEFEGAFMQEHQPGALLEGKIMRVEKFGAFVDLGNGVEGLVHVSEISWNRVHDAKEVVMPGQSVTVKLLKTEEVDGKLKISLSLKQADGAGNPWMQVPQDFPVGKVVKGTVEKKEVYGLFVNIGPGVTGLLPKSKWRDSLDAASYENKKRGDEVMVQIDEIMFEEKKISLGLPGVADDMSWKSHTTAKSDGFGSMADAFKGLNIKK